MTQDFDLYPSLGSALNDRFRGHGERVWTEWSARHFYENAAAIPDQAEQAWLGGEGKSRYRGLSTKKHIRHLIVGNADQGCIEELSLLGRLERLELECPLRADDLTPLLSLGSLRFLSIDSPRKMSNFSALLKLVALRTLLITNAKMLPDLEWLGSAHHLEVLGIEGSMSSTATIPSLAPLAGLSSLRALLATSTRLTDKDVMPLAQCPKLQFLQIARVAPRSGFERLMQARPDIHCEWFRPEMWKIQSARRQY